MQMHDWIDTTCVANFCICDRICLTHLHTRCDRICVTHLHTRKVWKKACVHMYNGMTKYVLIALFCLLHCVVVCKFIIRREPLWVVAIALCKAIFFGKFSYASRLYALCESIFLRVAIALCVSIFFLSCMCLVCMRDATLSYVWHDLYIRNIRTYTFLHINHVNTSYSCVSPMVYVSMHKHIYMFTCIYMYVCICVYMHICVYVCVYICYTHCK